MIDPKPSPERSERRVALLIKRAKRALNEAGIQVGGEHLIEPFVKAMIEECEGVRERSGQMIDTLVKRGDRITNGKRKYDADAMERLAYSIRNHYVDEDGEIQVAFYGED